MDCLFSARFRSAGSTNTCHLRKKCVQIEPVGFWRGLKKGRNYHGCCRAQVVCKSYCTKSLQALSALSGHSIFCKLT